MIAVGRRVSTADRRLSDLESRPRGISTAYSRLFDLESRPSPGAGWLVLGVLLACARPPTSPPSPATAVADPEPTVDASPATTPSVTDAWCRAEVFALEEMPEGSTLQSRMPSTPMIALATKSLSSTDCSSVGWHHLAFAPIEADASGLVGAYLKRHLPVVDRVPDAPYYLVGAKPESEHAIDLKDVCVSFRGRTNATPLWVVAIADDTELAQWKSRLTTGLCGRL